MENKKKTKRKITQRNLVVGMPWERPGNKFGTSQEHPGRLGRFMWKFTFKGQNICGTDGTDDGTGGTCPGDKRDTYQGSKFPGKALRAVP